MSRKFKTKPKIKAPKKTSPKFYGKCRNVDEFERMADLGEGAYGKVYQARDSKTREIIALKRIKMSSESDGMPITSLREINILRRVSYHKNVVQLKDIAVSKKLDSLYLVFEYCEHDLSCLLDRSSNSNKARFTESQVKNLMCQLLCAVKCLHDKKIIHRDIKLSNLLYTNKGVLKLADFGLSRYQNTFSKNMTPKVVTLWYRAPELLLGLKQYSGYAVDMWAIGCIFGELLLNKPIMPGKDEIGQLNEIVKLLGMPSGSVLRVYKTLPKGKLMGHVNVDKESKNRLGKKLKSSFASSKSYNMGMDLLLRMLEFDPVNRITVNEALKHNYFKCIPPTATIMPSFNNHFHRYKKSN